MELQAYLHSLIVELVQTPDQVTIETKEDGERVLFEVKVAENEVKLLVWRGGNTIRALQSALHIAGIKQDKKVSIKLLD